MCKEYSASKCSKKAFDLLSIRRQLIFYGCQVLTMTAI
jgi:hypothetical protein